MDIGAHVRAAMALPAEPSPDDMRRTGHWLAALGKAMVAIGNGDEGSMDELYDAVETGVDAIENLPGPDAAGKALLKRLLKGRAQALRDKVHHD